MAKDRVMIVERPDAAAAVDFLSEGAYVEMSIEGGKLRIVAKLFHGEDASTWDEHEVEWGLPERGEAQTPGDGGD